MANPGNSSGGAAHGGQQSIGGDSDQPVDGIEGSNPGTQQPAGQHVNAGGAGKGPGQRQQATPAATQTGVKQDRED